MIVYRQEGDQLPVLQSNSSFAAATVGATQPVGYVVATFAVSGEAVSLEN